MQGSVFGKKGFCIGKSGIIGFWAGKMQGFEMIAQGAEARLLKGNYLGKPTLVKERFIKAYRHPDLDKNLTKDRIKGEARAIVRAKSAGVATPTIYLIDYHRRSIFMEYIENSQTLKSFIDENISEKPDVEALTDSIGKAIGIIVAKLHSKNIIHGDLTTSNILLKESFFELDIKDEKKNKLIVIDFGLSRVDSTTEEAAVDLYVLERSLLSAHSEVPSLFPSILQSYQQNCNKSLQKEIIGKYEEVRMRGRKRLMIG